MALLTRARRAVPSEFTFNYYDRQKRLGDTSSLLKKEDQPPAPSVPPLLPRDVHPNEPDVPGYMRCEARESKSLLHQANSRGGEHESHLSAMRDLRVELLLQGYKVGGSWSAPPCVNPAIWRSSHQTKLHQAKSATSFSQRQREENKRLCEEVRSLTDSNLATVNRRLEDRRSDVAFWQRELEDRHIELSEDLNHLKQIRDRLEKQYDKFLQPLQVAQKCVAFRNERIGVEKVEDEASTALRQEIEEIIYSRSVLSKTFDDTKEQVRKVLSCLYHLENNVKDKRTASEVDKMASELTPLEPPSGIIPSQEIDPSPLSVSDWRNNSLNLAKRADREHNLFVQIASTGEAILSASARQVKETVRHTDEALHKRIETTRNAKSKLEEEHSKIVQEESELKGSIAELENELEAKREPLAIAQTRLKTRQSRPTREQTRDEAEAALLKEINELEMTKDRLLKALELSRRQLQSVTSSKFSLELDINLKTKTLHLDEVEVLGLRSTVHIDQC